MFVRFLNDRAHISLQLSSLAVSQSEKLSFSMWLVKPALANSSQALVNTNSLMLLEQLLNEELAILQVYVGRFALNGLCGGWRQAL
jgi:hypothetical protein